MLSYSTSGSDPDAEQISNYKVFVYTRRCTPKIGRKRGLLPLAEGGHPLVFAKPIFIASAEITASQSIIVLRVWGEHGKLGVGEHKTT
jgi:hypothetical protein